MDPLQDPIYDSLTEPLALKDGPISLKALASTQLYLKLGHPGLDKALGGGFPSKCLTEIFGRSSAGKTQIALQLCVTAQLPISSGGLGKGAIYIATEREFPVNRFTQIVKSWLHKFPPQTTLEDVNLNVKTILRHDLSMLLSVLQQLPNTLDLSQMGLLILDSIAAPFLGEVLPGRRKALTSLAHELQSLAHKYNLVVVCINQVTEVIRPQALHAPDPSMYTSELEMNPIQLPPGVKLTLGGQVNDPSKLSYQPALGLVWSNLINARILVSRCQSGSLRDNDNSSLGLPTSLKNVGSRRKLVTCACPWTPPASAHFYITADGLQDAEPEAEALIS
ncbi:DNA repair protein rhp57 [Entomophthora muscae]|uniref:DNA repair protein rhp57 n=1 Tax=Entomophthora muscae TaxID=34485 RepID=A0ACC2SD99_9FUNG|nr:DNA repair protein rhp57 [Entomophthora muscae]